MVHSISAFATIYRSDDTPAMVVEVNRISILLIAALSKQVGALPIGIEVCCEVYWFCYDIHSVYPIRIASTGQG